MSTFLEYFKAIDDVHMSKEKKKQKRKDKKGRLDRGLRAGDGGLAEGTEFGVFRKGGSIGSKNDDPIETFGSKDEAKAKAKSLRKQLTPGEKGYYKMGYTVRPIKPITEEIGSMQSPASFSADQNGSSRISITRIEDEEDLPMDDEMGMEDDVTTDDEDYMDDEYENPEDPNKMGTIRVIKGAHLVYKREDEGGAFEELWIYHTKDGSKEDIEVRRDILSGTDIPTNKKKSKDGTQSFKLWTVGNAQYLNIMGLPN